MELLGLGSRLFGAEFDPRRTVTLDDRPRDPFAESTLEQLVDRRTGRGFHSAESVDADPYCA